MTFMCIFGRNVASALVSKKNRGGAPPCGKYVDFADVRMSIICAQVRSAKNLNTLFDIKTQLLQPRLVGTFRARIADCGLLMKPSLGFKSK